MEISLLNLFQIKETVLTDENSNHLYNLFFQLWWSLLQSQFKLPYRKWALSSSFMLHMWGYVFEIWCSLNILFHWLLICSVWWPSGRLSFQWISFCVVLVDSWISIYKHYSKLLPRGLNQVTQNPIIADFSPINILVGNVACFTTGVQLIQNYLLYALVNQSILII